MSTAQIISKVCHCLNCDLVDLMNTMKENNHGLSINHSYHSSGQGKGLNYDLFDEMNTMNENNHSLSINHSYHSSGQGKGLNYDYLMK